MIAAAAAPARHSAGPEPGSRAAATFKLPSSTRTVPTYPSRPTAMKIVRSW